MANKKKTNRKQLQGFVGLIFFVLSSTCVPDFALFRICLVSIPNAHSEESEERHIFHVVTIMTWPFCAVAEFRLIEDYRKYNKTYLLM